MASTLINSLYPPFVDTFMPAFVEDGNADSANPTVAVIQFSISPYNATDTVKYVQVTLVNQETNQTVLNDGAYGPLENIVIRGGVLLVPFSEDLYNSESGLYEIEIPASYLKIETLDNGESSKGRFLLDVFYQAQLRFDNYTESITYDTLLSHLSEHRSHFSEWSSVTLLRAIPRPIFIFNNIDPETALLSPIAQVENEQGQVRWTKEDKTKESYVNEEYNRGLVPISATVYWYYNGSSIVASEFLTQYRVRIYKKGSPSEVLVDSGIVNVSNNERNSIYYLADMNQAEENTDYIIRIDGVSRNDYSWWDEREITISVFNSIPFNLSWNFNKVQLNSYNDTIEKIVTEEDGFIKCQVTSAEAMPPGYLYIFRSSSLDNYKENKVIQVTYHNGTISTEFEDRTVGSLVQYRYKAQYKIKATNTWSRVQQAPTYVYPDFYDMLFMRQDKQLAVRFDGNLSNLKPVVNRTKIDTLGSKYPRFAENALMNYKQFSLSGIISAEEDYNRQFVNEKTDADLLPGMNAYKENIGQVDLVRNDTILESVENPALRGFHDTYPHDHWYLEREFREKVMSWLNDGEPKLFRSMTEGNMIVMLTDVSLSPVQNTNRRLYSFNATMYEIGDGYDLDELVYHKIVFIRDEEHWTSNSSSTPKPVEDEYITITKVGQYNNTYFTYNQGYFNVVGLNNGNKGLQLNDDTGSLNLATASLTDLIRAELRGINKNYKFVPGSIRLSDVRIQFISKPYWIKNENGILSRVEDTGNVDPATQGLMLGYFFQIIQDANEVRAEENARTIFVGPKGYYQVPKEIQVKEFHMHPNDDFSIDYKIEYLTEYDTSGLITKTQTLRRIVGQQSGVFQPNEWLGDSIREKYHYREYTGESTLTSLKSEELMETWTGLSLDVTPYADAYIRTTESSDWEECLVGQTGVYNLMTDYPIDDLYFTGRRMVIAPMDNRPYLDEWQYVLDQTVTNATPEQEEDVEDYWYEIIQASPSYVQQTDTVVRVAIDEDEDLQEIFSYWGELDYNNYQNLYGYIKVNNIDNPQYNTVYKFIDSNGENPVYLIYYLDQGWYPVIFENDEKTILIAKVPISGMINYRGTVIKHTYLT